MPAARVMVISEDDDAAGPLEALLKHAGYGVEVLGGRDAALALAEGPPDVLVLDRDLPPENYQQIVDRLTPGAGRSSVPLVILGGGASPRLPQGWHEDAFASLPRPPQTGELLATIAGLRRLVFYRRYRDLVHDLSQPVTTLHALSRAIAKLPAPDEPSRRTVDRLVQEAERLMSLLENFQRSRSIS
ncbi:MAG: hypothetical protein AUH92_00475 [Acidobacteria bacterium 13_1_40CM_4_69_4]|nr:MAG: hypothetical protein AUH92_00475 [Acidobacteria bacterium 13_1_40CM_4_69_4]